MSLAHYTSDELRAELRRRDEAAPCQCGPARRTITEHVAGFTPRGGCLTCNKWDNPPRLINP